MGGKLELIKGQDSSYKSTYYPIRVGQLDVEEGNDSVFDSEGQVKSGFNPVIRCMYCKKTQAAVDDDNARMQKLEMETMQGIVGLCKEAQAREKKSSRGSWRSDCRYDNAVKDTALCHFYFDDQYVWWGIGANRKKQWIKYRDSNAECEKHFKPNNDCETVVPYKTGCINLARDAINNYAEREYDFMQSMISTEWGTHNNAAIALEWDNSADLASIAEVYPNEVKNARDETSEYEDNMIRGG